MTKVKLWEHQQKALDNFGDKNFLYAGMSSGKTTLALAWIADTPGMHLVLTPKAALNVYVEDNAKLFGNSLNILTLDKGTSKKKRERIDAVIGQDVIVVVNYETARLLGLSQWPWQTAVADECHKLGTHNGVATLNLTKELADVPRKLAMTGTPYHDGYEKLYGVFRWLMPEIHDNANKHPTTPLFGSYADFEAEYCVTYTHPKQSFVQIITGYKNITKLSQVLGPYSQHIATEDVVDLPAMVSSRVRVPMLPATKKLYRKFKEDSFLHIEGEDVFANNQLTKLLRLSQFTNSGQVVNEFKEVVATVDIKPRVQALELLLEQLNGEPAVIFTRFVADQKLVGKAVQDVTGQQAKYLNGQTDQTQSWRNGAGQVLIANIAAGAEGLRLERANKIIFWSLGYSHSQHKQAIARVRRSNQEAATVYVYEIVTDGSIDEDVYEALHHKALDTTALDTALDQQAVYTTRKVVSQVASHHYRDDPEMDSIAPPSEYELRKASRKAARESRKRDEALPAIRRSSRRFLKSD